MAKQIDDTGKVWRPGRFKPEAAVRVDGQVFILGEREGETSLALAAEAALLVDLHDRARGARRALRFPYALKPQGQATLFNGFTRTKHGDVGVIAPEDPGVEVHCLEGEAYWRAGAANLEPEEWFRSAGFLHGSDQ